MNKKPISGMDPYADSVEDYGENGIHQDAVFLAVKSGKYRNITYRQLLDQLKADLNIQ